MDSSPFDIFHMQTDYSKKPLEQEILRALLYYDIWQHPLSTAELFAFLPVNSLSYPEFCTLLNEKGPGGAVAESCGYFFVKARDAGIVDCRLRKERNALSLWKKARLSAHIIKRFPYVRGIFVSGDLSKNVTTPESDVDFFIITVPGRLWIARSMLILFKKVFLFNSKKYFCLNYFTAEDNLLLDEHNVFLATEVAHLKPLYNTKLFVEYLRQNNWIRSFFPNFTTGHLPLPRANDRRSIVQRALEALIDLLPADRLDMYLLDRMRKIWKFRYPELDDSTRERIFRSTRRESRAYAGDYQDRILNLYHDKLREFGIER
jgi:hypothetical protein